MDRFFIKKAFWAILPVLLLSACQKKDDTTPQPDKVAISIQSPSAGQVFSKGDTIRINAQIEYISQLHGYLIEIKDSATKKLVYSTEGHTHSDRIEIQEKWVDTLTGTQHLVMEIAAIIDHNENKTTATRYFSSQP